MGVWGPIHRARRCQCRLGREEVACRRPRPGAAAANEAYRAGDFSRARQLVDQAAAHDPSQASLWQRHHSEIEAKRLLRDAQAAQAEGDQGRASQLMQEVAQLDPRMRALRTRTYRPSRKPRAVRWPAPVRAVGVSLPAQAQHAGPRDPSGGNSPRWPAKPPVSAQASPQASRSGDSRQPSRDCASPAPPRPTMARPTQQRDAEQRSRAHPSAPAAGDSGPADWRDTAMQRDRQEWQPKVAPRHDEPTVSVEIQEAEISVDAHRATPAPPAAGAGGAGRRHIRTHRSYHDQGCGAADDG